MSGILFVALVLAFGAAELLASAIIAKRRGFSIAVSCCVGVMLGPLGVLGLLIWPTHEAT